MPNNGETELYRRHRPTSFAGVLGQPQAVAQLNAMGKDKAIPHALLLTGPSGTGKTTIGRILRIKLKCGDADFYEINAAKSRGIDDIRAIDEKMRLAPMSGDCRIWLIDECHKLTSDGQSALLKMLEDPPRHVYFMLATTDELKLIQTIRSRCTRIVLSPVAAVAMRQLLVQTVKAEEKEIDADALDRIVELARGNARSSLVMLHQIINLPVDTQLQSIKDIDAEVEGIEIARKLLNPKSQWKDVAVLLKESKQQPEEVRRIVMGYAAAILMNGKQDARAFSILQEFCDPIYDSLKPGLVRACFAVFGHCQ